MSICLSVYPCVCLFTHLFISLPIDLSAGNVGTSCPLVLFWTVVFSTYMNSCQQQGILLRWYKFILYGYDTMCDQNPKSDIVSFILEQFLWCHHTSCILIVDTNSFSMVTKWCDLSHWWRGFFFRTPNLVNVKKCRWWQEEEWKEEINQLGESASSVSPYAQGCQTPYVG